jgi:EAL domain-containing protein (putative c-di-GMP-specific phosphodiesterase class I)
LIRLEITESVIMADPVLIIERLKTLHEMGIILSIDDFGTGYSSLSYLHNYPFDFIKIDQSFIATMLTDHKSERLVASLIKLSQDLGLKTVAEGIETEEQRLLLKSLGCTYGQGYLFSEALPPTEASNIVFQRHRYFLEEPL